MGIKEWADENRINLVFLNPHRMSTFRRNEQGVLVEDELTTLLLAMLSYGATMEMKIKKARFETAKKNMKLQGKAIGQLVYGYTKDEEKNIVINKEESKIVIWVFDCLINKGMSTTAIYKEGIELGYFTKKKNYTHGATCVLAMLKNHSYCGENTRGIKYPSIVSRETMDKAAKILNDNLIKPKYLYKNVYYCKGLIRNALDNMILTPMRNNATYTTNNRTEKHFALSANVCDTIIWREAAQIKWTLLSNQKTQNLQNYKKQIEDLKVKIWNNEVLISDVQKRFEKAYNGYINSNGKITNKMYESQIEVLDKEENEYKTAIDKYNIRLNELEQLINNAETKEAKDIAITDIKDITDDTQRKDIINEVISNMSVKEVGKGEFYIDVFNVLDGDIPMTYYYKHSGHKMYLEMVIDDENRIDITNEIVKRILSLRDIRKLKNIEQ